MERVKSSQKKIREYRKPNTSSLLVQVVVPHRCSATAALLFVGVVVLLVDVLWPFVALCKLAAAGTCLEGGLVLLKVRAVIFWSDNGNEEHEGGDAADENALYYTTFIYVRFKRS